jgi:tetratricopeptide (TPR) repeat protein
MHFDWDWLAAEQNFRCAIELNPSYATAHHWYGSSLGALHRFDEALAELNTALEIDPLSLIINTDLGQTLWWAGQYDRSIEQLQTTIEMDASFLLAHIHLGIAYTLKGDISKGIEQLQRALQIDDDPLAVGALGYAYAISGDTEEAKKTLSQLYELSGKRFVSPYNFATVYTGLRNKERAFEFLQQCFEQKSVWMAWIKVDPLMANLRSDARFLELLQKVGLEE